ncbi:MAG: hypothetical protein Q8R82_01700 [Hyphomonadaceae bacterium]|nr:hypothetical protein [Hyphomonadaceae bacterium]
MKRIAAFVLAVLITAPALAQQGATQIEVEGRPLIDQWIAGFNKGDVPGLAKDVYVNADEAALTKTFTQLREDSFGQLDVYAAAFCASDATHGKALLKYGRVFAYGGLMNGDEAKVFDLVKTDAGWRIAAESDVPYATALSC